MNKNIQLALCLSFLLVFSTSSGVSAQASTGGTVINMTVSGVWILSLSLQHPEIIVPEDYYFFENLTLYQINTENISVYLNKSDTNGFVKFLNITGGGSYYQNDYTLYLPRDTPKNITLRIYVPAGMGYDGGTYNIQINGDSLDDFRYNTTTLKVHVNTTSPIDDIRIISLYPPSLYSGESVSADISIHKIYPAETTDIQLCYCVDESSSYPCGPAYNNYGCEWRSIKEWLNYTKTVSVSMPPGDYYFITAVKYPNDENIKRAISPVFHISSVTPGPGPGPSGPPGIPRPALSVSAPDYIESFPGGTVRFDVAVKNTGNANAPGTTLRLYGVPENWVYLAPLEQDIGIGESKNYTISISLPRDAHEQLYSLHLVAKSGTVESTRDVTLTVAMNLKDQVRFLIGEAKKKQAEAREVVETARNWRMNVADPQSTMLDADAALTEAEELFGSGDYGEAADKAKQAIDGYKSVTESVKRIVGETYVLFLDGIIRRIKNIESLAEERDAIGAIWEKVNRSTTFHRQGRMIEAYKTVVEAEQLLVQLEGKLFFRDLVQNVIIISIFIVIVVAISMLVFYKKRMSGFLKTMRIEEHKKNLKRLFQREVRPTLPQKAKPDREKLSEIRRLLDAGESSVGIDIETAREVYSKIRDIYNSMSPEERRAIRDEFIRITRLYNKIAGESR